MKHLTRLILGLSLTAGIIGIETALFFILTKVLGVPETRAYIITVTLFCYAVGCAGEEVCI